MADEKDPKKTATAADPKTSPKAPDAAKKDGAVAQEDAKPDVTVEPLAPPGSMRSALDEALDVELSQPSKPTSPWPSSRKSVAPGPEKTAAAKAPPDEEGTWPKRAWGQKLSILDQKWTRLEARLLWWVLAAEIFALCFTVLISGLATDPGGGAMSGIVLRSTLGALVLGFIAHRVMKGRPYHQVVVTALVIVGLALGPKWASSGVQYFGNVRNWMQNASVLLFVGGVTQLAKRLTLWLALLGASVATAQGKHISVDVVMRFLGPRARVPVAVLGWLFAAIVCFAGVRAFFDELAIADFRAVDEKPCVEDPKKSCQTSEGERLSEMTTVMKRDFFLLGRQATLDVKSLPKVIGGTRYDDWLTTEEWNAWMREGNWEAYYPKADVESLQMPLEAGGKRSPAVIVPGAAENPQELMMRELDLIVPFGLFMIALRFVLRALLALAGWVKVDPNAAHADELGPNEADREKKEEEDLKASAKGGAA